MMMIMDDNVCPLLTYPPIPFECDYWGNKQGFVIGESFEDNSQGDATMDWDVAAHVVLHEAAWLLLKTGNEDNDGSRGYLQGLGEWHPIIHL